MKKKFYALFFVAILWLCLGKLSQRCRLPVPSAPNPAAQNLSPNSSKNSPRDVSGSIHFHTIYSDGSGDIPQIIRAANQNKLDFLIVTDHGAEPKKHIAENFYDEGSGQGKSESESGRKILLLAGSELGSEELGREEGGHYLVFDKMQILAHPFHPLIPWKNLSQLDAFNGIEIYTGSTILQRAMVHVFPLLWAAIFYPFNPDYAILSICKIPERELDLWNKMSRTKPVVGIVSTDAHAKIILWKSSNKILRFPSYRMAFKTLKNHLLLDRPLQEMPFEEAKNSVYEAIAQGHFYSSLDFLLDPSGFNFSAIQNEKEFPMGCEIQVSSSSAIVLQAHLGALVPQVPKVIRLLRNGREIFRTPEDELQLEVKNSGNYRIEVYLEIPNAFGRRQRYLWIISNSIRILD